MSGTLREALLKITGDLVARAEEGEPHLLLTVPLRDLEQLLADHPAEPVSTLQEIQERAAAATPGPWMWRGNVDHQDPILSWYKPGWGRCEVLRHYPRERQAGDPETKAFDDYLRDVSIRDNATGEYRSYTDEERADQVRTEWLEDESGEPRTDTRLAFAHPEYMHALDARELAVFEVCPTATDRNDPRVYRADIVGVRHPDAEFIAHSRQDVDDLLAIIAKVRQRAESWYDDLENLTDETCIEGAGCPCCHARDILSVLGDDRPAVRPVREVVTVQVAGDVL